MVTKATEGINMSIMAVGAADYSKAIDGLSLSQAKLLLSMQGVDAEQQKSLLLQAGLISSSEKMTASHVAQALSNTTLKNTEQERILVKAGLMNAQSKELLLGNSCTEAKLREVLATTTLSSTEKDAVVSRILGTTTNGGYAISFDVLTASIWANIKAMAKWLVTNPVGWCVLAVGAIAGLSKIIDELVVTEEELNEQLDELSSKWDELSSTIQNSSKSFQSLKSQADELIPRYAELAQGVDKYGKNVSLTDEEFSEFVSLNNQLAQMFPELVMGYDSNGNAILALSGNVDTLTESLYAFVEAQRIASAQTIADTMPEVMSNIDSTVEAYKSQIKIAEDSMEDLKELYDTFKNDGFVEEWSSTGESMVSAAKILNKYGIDYSSEITGERNGIVGSTRYKITVDWDDFETSYDGVIAGYEKKIDDLGNRIESKWKQLNPVVSAWLSTDFLYQDMDVSGQSLVTAMVSEIDFKSLGLKTEKEIQNYITNSIISPIYDMDTATQQAFFDVFDLHEALNNGELSVQEYQDKINAILENGKYSQEFTTIFKLAFAEDDLQDEYNKAIAKFGKDNKDTLEKFFTDNSINTTEEIDYWNKVTDGAKTASDAVEMYNKAKGNTFNNKNIVSLTDFLVKLDENAIDNYQKKISSLKSYLDKIKSGDYSSTDLLSLADEFGITGDSIEELTEKIQNLMNAEMNTIISQINKILDDENLNESTKIAVENLKQSLIDTNKEAQNLKSTLFNNSGNPLENVQMLSEGLDQLDKIYADILDKEDFDWSSILNNDQFKEQFGAYTEEYDNFINTVSKSPNDISACQDAFNKLTAAYIKGSGVLSEVTEATKAGTIAMLKQMGVANAAAIVEQALIENEKMLEAQKYATAQGCDDLRKATYEEINALIAEGKTTEEVIKYLAKLALEKWELSEKKLDTQADCDNLLKLAGYAGATTSQIKELKNAMADLNTFDYTNPMGSAFSMTFNKAFSALADKLPESFKESKLFQNFAENSGLNAKKSIEETMVEIRKNLEAQLDIPEFKVDYTGGTTTKDTLERLAKEKEKEDKKKEETAENIGFIEIKLNNLIDTASKAKDKISDLLSFGAKKKQTQKAIEATTKALEAEYKAMKQYAKFAESFSADAAKETIETVTDDVSSAVIDAVSNIASSTAGVVNDAMQYVDKLPYVWGGESLVNGADCSGFVMQLYKKYGINLPHNSQAQFNSGLGTKVYNQQDLQPGDLVFFGSGANNIHHVGIYAGDGKFIEERGRKWGTKLSPLAGRDYYAGLRFGNINNTPSSSASSTVSNDTSSTTTTTYTKVVPGIDSKTLAHYQKLVREGSFDIETITNEKLKNAIKSYQEWYDKMKSCRDKIDELNNDLKELYKTMAQIPIEKRDKNVETLDTRLDILNSKRENISAVIVDPKKYDSTKKTLKSSKTDVKKGLKGLRTKAQMKSAGLGKTDIDTIKKQMKNGQTIPAKILDKITDGAFYEQCKQYNDAVYEHSQYAKTMRTAGDSIKKFNTISDQILSAEKSKTKQFKTAYNDVSKSYGKSLDNVKSKGNKTRKAFDSKKFGLSDADIKRIKSCINAGKQIPTDLMAQLESQSVYDSCVEYNKAVMENEAFREQLDNARFDLQKQQQAETAARLQNKTEKHQNIADKASAKMERNEVLAENADAPKKKNKYLSQNLDLLQTEYKHLIKIAELENDSVKAAKLRAELEKETADIIEQQFQNISDYYSARRDKISDKESLQDVRYENAQVDVKKKNDILNVKTRFATERNAESEQEYTDTAKLFNSNRKDAKKAVNKVKKLSSSDKDKILKLMESKEEIPENLMDKVSKLDPDAYQKLLNYNDSLDWLEKAALNKKISNEELIKTKRENEIQKHQNVADRAQDKMDKNDALSEISTSASEQNKYEKENIKYLNTQYKHLLEIAKLHEDDVEYARLEAEQQAKIAEAYKAMFDNVQTEFENKISLISNDISDLDNEIKKVEASGRLVDASYYNHKISFENESLAKLKEEETSLVEQLKNIQMFSPAWYECQDAIQSVQNAQADSLSKVKEYKDAINAIADTIQNDIVDAFHEVTDEAELLITLLGDDLSDEDTGVLTKDGLAVLSLYVSQMNICKDAAESFHKEINSMQDALDSGTLSFIDANGIQREYASVFELKKAIKDFYSSYRDEIKHVYDYESKIVDMMIKKYQSELDYLKELIEKKKAELDAEKDLHDYAKSLKEQTDNINSLRKQIAALKGDTSKETESRIQKLQSQLKEAESSLEDQEYERFISDSKDILDNLYSEYEKLVNDVMKDHDRLLREGLDLFAQTASDVQDVIKITAEEHGYEITAEMEKIIASIEGMGHLDSYLGVGGTVTQSLSDIVNEVHNAYVGISAEFQGLKDAIASSGYQGKYNTTDTDHTDYSINDSSSNAVNSGSSVSANTPSNSAPNIDVSNLPNMDSTGLATKRFIEDLLKNGTNTDYDPKKASSLNKYIYGKYGRALTVDEMAKLSEYLGFNYTSKQLATENPNHSERKMKILKKLQAYGFSNGGIVPDDALKLKDLGISRASNGDTVIGTLKPKESVFNEKQTKMIREYVNKGPDLESLRKLTPVLDKVMKMPEIEKNNTQTQTAYFGDVSFNLPNVASYADFMNQAKKDPEFEKMIGCIIRHQLGFGSYLKKTNVTFRN